MRFAVLAAALAPLYAFPASAQVTINLRALDTLPHRAGPTGLAAPHHALAHPSRPAPSPKAPLTVAQEQPKPTPHPATQAPTPAAPSPAQHQQAPQHQQATQHRQAAASQKSPPPAPPTVPAAPPAPPPPTELATNLPAGPPAGAPGSAPAGARTTRTLDVQFAPGATALTSSETKSVAELVRNVHPSATTTFEVAAHAPEVNGDASSARRLSLARAVAVRSALIANGVPAGNIYMRALGAPSPSHAAQADSTIITATSASGGASPAPKQASKQP